MPAWRIFKGLATAVGGAITGAVLWFIVNTVVRLGDVGWLPGREAWWAEWYTWVAAGAAVAFLHGLRKDLGRRRRAEEMEQAARFLGFEYEGATHRERLQPFSSLPLFEKWQAADHYMHGEFGGLHVEMLDYTYRHEGSGDSAARDYEQTVVLLPGGEGWPAFRLQPRDLGVRLLTATLGVEGIALACDNPTLEREYRAFDKRFFLSTNMEGLAAGLSSPYVSGGTERAQKERAVQCLFSPAVVRFFYERRDWRIQCDGRSLAVWRSGRLTHPAALPALVRDAVELRHHLAEAARSASKAEVAPADAAAPAEHVSLGPSAQPLAMAAGRLLGFFGGSAAGGVVGGVGAMVTLIALDDGETARLPARFLLAAVLFFGGSIIGSLAGVVLGRRWLAPLVVKLMEIRQRRLNVADPQRRS